MLLYWTSSLVWYVQRGCWQLRLVHFFDRCNLCHAVASNQVSQWLKTNVTTVNCTTQCLNWQSDTNMNTANYTTQNHTTLQPHPQKLAGIWCNVKSCMKWIVKSPSAVVVPYISTYGMPLVQSKCLVGIKVIKAIKVIWLLFDYWEQKIDFSAYRPWQEQFIVTCSLVNKLSNWRWLLTFLFSLINTKHTHKKLFKPTSGVSKKELQNCSNWCH